MLISNALVAGCLYRLTINIQKWHYRSWPCRRYGLRQPIETVQIVMRWLILTSRWTDGVARETSHHVWSHTCIQANLHCRRVSTLLIVGLLPHSTHYRSIWWQSSKPLLFSINHWGIPQQKVYKAHITELDLSAMPLTNGCHNDDVIQFGPLHSQSDFYVIQSDACFVCTP